MFGFRVFTTFRLIWLLGLVLLLPWHAMAQSPHMTVQFASTVIQVPTSGQSLRKAYLTIFVELAEPDQIALVCGRYRQLNEIASLVSLKHQMKNNEMPVAQIRKEMKQRIRRDFPDVKFEDVHIIEGRREFGEGARMMNMPGTNEHCYSLNRTPLDVLARDRPVVAGAADFDEAVLLDNAFPLALASAGSGTAPEGEPVPIFYIVLGGVALILTGVAMAFGMRARGRRKRAAGRRRAVERRRKNAGAPGGVERRGKVQRRAQERRKMDTAPPSDAEDRRASKRSSRQAKSEGLKSPTDRQLHGRSWNDEDKRRKQDRRKSGDTDAPPADPIQPQRRKKDRRGKEDLRLFSERSDDET